MERRYRQLPLRATRATSATEVALARQASLTKLALSGLSGSTPYRLSVEARDLIATQLDAIVTIETRSGQTGNGPVRPPASWFSVPIGENGRHGNVLVGSLYTRTFSREEIAFVEAVADVLNRAGDAHRDAEWLRHQASHDPLTGLPNRAALDAKLQSVTHEQVPVGVLVCDLDGLKLVNDHLGHRRGDELLVATAARIRNAARTGDLVARTGGDEFVVVCSVVTAEECQAIAQRIQAATAAPIQMDDYEVTTSVSVGIALSDAPGDTADLIDRADAAMYRSKELRGGRRRRLRAHPAGEALDVASADDVVVVDMFGGGIPGTGAPQVRLVQPGSR